jgi:branched-chain amino acid aminotransferase
MSNTYIYYINGQWVLSNEATIPFNDLGFLYGDGLFETLRFDNHNIFAFEKHFTRLKQGLKIINLKITCNQNQLYDLFKKIISKNKLNSGILRLMITRGNQNKKTNEITPNIYISIKPFYSIPSKPVKIIFYSENAFPLIRYNPAIKSMNYLGNMLAKKQCDKDGAFEPAFYNTNKIITECAIRNIFFIKNEELFTPSLDLGILSGVMRETILLIAKSLNLQYHESYINIDNINIYDEAFITSTGIGLLPCYWEGFKSKYELTSILKKELFNRINNN